MAAAAPPIRPHCTGTPRKDLGAAGTLRSQEAPSPLEAHPELGPKRPAPFPPRNQPLCSAPRSDPGGENIRLLGGTRGSHCPPPPTRQVPAAGRPAGPQDSHQIQNDPWSAPANCSHSLCHGRADESPRTSHVNTKPTYTGTGHLAGPEQAPQAAVLPGPTRGPPRSQPLQVTPPSMPRAPPSMPRAPPWHGCGHLPRMIGRSSTKGLPVVRLTTGPQVPGSVGRGVSSQETEGLEGPVHSPLAEPRLSFWRR